ncbi:hypothetical protein PoB_000446100 [Plakobranchus ocellatus]|uniref:Uncharacterized protein n=1 Tax=Plakobranchus ocellatus TaxID=259542 RepID=A0AAV3Y420_9GAST|nr:hypothetical protein PoB_000446100 [Plakobranchus ocellatus]
MAIGWTNDNVRPSNIVLFFNTLTSKYVILITQIFAVGDRTRISCIRSANVYSMSLRAPSQVLIISVASESYWSEQKLFFVPLMVNQHQTMGRLISGDQVPECRERETTR